MVRAFVLSIALWLTPAIAAAATIVVYGDSLSSGYGLSQGEGWVSLLARRLQEQRRDYDVVNASISGETTHGGVRRIGDVLRAHRPAIVIVELGANDGLRGQNIQAMERNLDAIVAACLGAGARVVLVGMHLPPNYGRAYTEKFHRAFVTVARKRNLPFVPFLLDGFAENRALFQSDALHPTAQAQPAMLETIWPVLQPLLSKPAVKIPPRRERRS
jgi:acyl-CoA thioesterase-1